MKGESLTIRNAGVRLKSEKEEKAYIPQLHGKLEKACQIFGIAIPTGYLRIRQWNQNGYEGILDCRRPEDAEVVLENHLFFVMELRSIKNTTRFKTNTIGFYEKVQKHFWKAQKPANFLERVKKVNSPDLNPIEHIWRSKGALLDFCGKFDKVITDNWDKLSKRISYAKGWVGRFLEGKQYYMDLCG